MSVPLHWNEDELPIGVHFVGRFGDSNLTKNAYVTANDFCGTTAF